MSLADVARELQERGFLKTDADPRMLAAFVQAYAFGRVLDDQSQHPLDGDSWVNMVDTVLRAIL